MLTFTNNQQIRSIVIILVNFKAACLFFTNKPKTIDIIVISLVKFKATGLHVPLQMNQRQ